MPRRRFSTSTLTNDARFVPWLAAEGPLSYSPESPPASDYYFQYGWVLPDIFSEVDPVIAKAIVGHQTDAMRQHYSTLASDDARQAADAVSALLFGADPTDASSANADAK